jgi:hypothetical protein
MIPHEMKVSELKKIIEQLQDDDLLVMNEVRNLAIYRRDTYIGFIDFNINERKLIL